MKVRSLLCAGLCLSISSAVAVADVVTDWNQILVDAIRVDETPSPEAARAIAMMNLAIFDTVNSFDPIYEEYLTLGAPTFGATAEASAVAAARRILVALFPDQEDTFNAAVDEYVGGLPAFAFDGSNTYGTSIANALLAVRDFDNSSTNLNYDPGSAPGDWQPTPPGNEDAELAHWGNVIPFAISSGSQFRRSGPPELTTARYATDFDEVYRYGSADSTDRSEDQTHSAQFWNDGVGTATTPGHWIEMAITISVQEENTFVQNTRVFALIGLALADAGITAWDNKYAYGDWRPVTAIHNALLDLNADTTADPTWEPLIDAPPHPGYVSAQSAYSGAAARMMAIIYGKDAMTFTATSDTLGDDSRTFSSLTGAAEEAGFATVVSGQCFRYAHADGLAAGREVASYIHANFLTRLPVDPNASGGCGGGSGGCGLGGLFTLAGMLISFPIMRRSSRRSRR